MFSRKENVSHLKSGTPQSVALRCPLQLPIGVAVCGRAVLGCTITLPWLAAWEGEGAGRTDYWPIKSTDSRECARTRRLLV